MPSVAGRCAAPDRRHRVGRPLRGGGRLEVGTDAGQPGRRPLPRPAQVVAGHRLDDLEVDLELGLGARRAHDDPRVVGEVVAQALGRREPAVAARQVVGPGHVDAGHRPERLRPQPLHDPADQREVLDAHREGVGGVDPVLAGQVVEPVDERAALGPQRRRELRDEQRRRDAVLVAHALRVDAVAERLLVAVAEPRHPPDPLEPGEGLLVPDPRRRAHRRELARGHDRVGEHAVRGVGDDPTVGPERQHVRPEQRTDLVAAQHPPPARTGHRDGAPVGVRVVGDDDVG